MTIKGVGEVKISVYAPETEAFKKSAAKTITLHILAAANPMTVKGKTIPIKYKNVKKKAQVISAKKAFTVKNAKGNVTYKKAGGQHKQDYRI